MMDQSKTPLPAGRSPEPLRRSSTDARREREAEALRANLRKRKEQQRARETPARGMPDEPPHESHENEDQPLMSGKLSRLRQLEPGIAFNVFHDRGQIFFRGALVHRVPENQTGRFAHPHRHA
jgi:hypothetical protein